MKNRTSLLAALRPVDLWAASEDFVYDLCLNIVQRGDLEWTAAFTRPAAATSRAGKVAVIPVYGMIEQHTSALDEYFGITSLDTIRTQLRAALADSQVKAIVLDIDSPGGGVYGVTELAAEIRAARGGKMRIVAQANSLAASAAYWLASQADEVVVSPSGSVGSIGVIAVHQEYSRALEAEGVTTTIISTGKYKAEGNPFQPLDDEARTNLQERSDAFYAAFVADVAKGRRTTQDNVKASYGEGRVMLSGKALEAGMVDRVESFDQTMARLQEQTGAVSAVRAAGGLIDFDAVAVGRHHTDTSDASWDAGANEGRLPSPMTMALARRAYAWIDESREQDGEVPKDACKFIHHEVSAEGDPGAANLTACSAGIAVLNGGRGGSTIPSEDRRGVYNHLAGHLRDAHTDDPSYEPPALKGEQPASERLVALAAEAQELAQWASNRAHLRASEGRPLFSTRTETALRATRDAIDALLLGDPGEAAVSSPGEPAPISGASAPPPRKVAPVSRDDFLQHIRR